MLWVKAEIRDASCVTACVTDLRVQASGSVVAAFPFSVVSRPQCRCGHMWGRIIDVAAPPGVRQYTSSATRLLAAQIRWYRDCDGGGGDAVTETHAIVQHSCWMFIVNVNLGGTSGRSLRVGHPTDDSDILYIMP